MFLTTVFSAFHLKRDLGVLTQQEERKRGNPFPPALL
jgi:hypothetical protein